MRRCILLAAVVLFLVGSPKVRAEIEVPSARATRGAMVDVLIKNLEAPSLPRALEFLKGLEQDAAEYRGLQVLIGEQWTRNQQPILVAAWCGTAFDFQLTPAQARALNLEPSGLQYARLSKVGADRMERRENPLPIETAALTIDNRDAVDGSRDITGSIEYDVKAALPETFKIRLSFSSGTTTTSMYSPPIARRLEGKGVYRFSFNQINSRDETSKVTGPLAVFVEFVQETGGGDDRKATLLSTTKGTLIVVGNLAQGQFLDLPNRIKPPRADEPILEGTRWKFPGTESTVEFRSGGKFLWNGEPTNGSWNRDGNKVTINVNDFTLFSMTLDGDSMTGTWERLQGEDKGKKNSSSLKRIAGTNRKAPVAENAPRKDASRRQADEPILEGTRWQFPGTESTIEFRSGGKFLWNGESTNGSWNRDGNKVTINLNDFTLFSLTLNGDSMTGTWERLQGEDKGKKNSSSLKRITSANRRAPAVDNVPSKDALRRQVLDWLQENYRDDDKTSEKVRQTVISDIDGDSDFHLTFGPGVIVSGKPFQIHVFSGRFCAIEFTTPQIKKLLSGPNGVNYSGGKRGYSVGSTPRAVVRQPKIDNAAQLDPTKKVTGTLAYEIAGRLPEKLAVRLSFRSGKSYHGFFHHLKDGLSNERGVIAFAFDAINKDGDENKVRGPVVVFLDLCTITEEPDPNLGGAKVPKFTAVSNPIPVVVDLPGTANDE